MRGNDVAIGHEQIGHHDRLIQQAARIAAQVQNGALEIGPQFVLD